MFLTELLTLSFQVVTLAKGLLNLLVLEYKVVGILALECIFNSW